jgi:hypothetical protein
MVRMTHTIPISSLVSCNDVYSEEITSVETRKALFLRLVSGEIRVGELEI